ncbi:unnamed protein product [Fraxinus pennsylvanica]|uniref:RRM domain-containing protein n=1 Tax=Fraxinus pennsylvanica TaxID=56036 RepID=A0AAD1ZXR7_9LAMI|nr:unnamed protein product [Fraxinus pennsylvanica]
MAKGFELPEYYLRGGRKVNLTSGKQVVGEERASSHSLPNAVNHDLGARPNSIAGSASYCMDAAEINIVGDRYENGLFSSSLSDLFARKYDAPYGHSVGGTASHYKEEEPFESLEEIEAQTIANLLPDDEDLFSGVTDGFGCIARPNKGDDVEDLDLFSSVGGLELGEDGSLQRNSKFPGVHSVNLQTKCRFDGGEHPSRTLFVRNINGNIEDSELRTLFEQYGDICTLYTASKHWDYVMVSYYDIRAACNAMKALQSKPLWHRKLDIHFSIPKENPCAEDINQGILVVFNLDYSMSNDELRQIFGVYGKIKEIRETQNRSNHKFIEFYDVRAADAALRALNDSGIEGKCAILDPSRPDSSRRIMQKFSSKLDQEEFGLKLQRDSPPIHLTEFSGPFLLGGITSSIESGTIMDAHSTNGVPVNPLLDNMFHHGVSSSVPDAIRSLVRVGSIGCQSNVNESGHAQSHLKFELGGTPYFHPHSLPDYHRDLSSRPSCDSPGNITANISVIRQEMMENQQFGGVSSNGQQIDLNDDGVFSSSGTGSCPLPGCNCMWSTSHYPQPKGIVWPNSPSFVNEIGNAHPHQLHAVPRARSHMLNGLLPINNLHVGSAPSFNPSLWDRQRTYVSVSPDYTVFHPGSLGNMRISGHSYPPMEFGHHNIFPSAGGNFVDLPIPSKSFGLHSHHQNYTMFPERGQMIPIISSFDYPTEQTRSRRNEGSSSQTDNKKQFELDIGRIAQGEDKRTTIMIKNIPNKYTSKMLLAAIDERHRGTYDFIYLPIDFKNKCNVGYAFINMNDPSLIIPFYETFNGKKWEKFNSEKVASLAYGRIQGKAALVAHFQNSSLMNEDKKCRPILFHRDGPNAGDQVPFPMGNNFRPKSSKNRACTTEENYQEIISKSVNGNEYNNGDSSSGLGKDSD